MDVLLEALRNPGDMDRAQWLMVVIMLFVVVGLLYFVWRLYRIVLNSSKQTYKPNIGLKRVGPGARSAAGTEASAKAASAAEERDRKPGDDASNSDDRP